MAAVKQEKKSTKDRRPRTVKSMTRYNRRYKNLQEAVRTKDIKGMQWALVEMLVDDIKLQELGKNNTFKDLVRMVGRLGSAKPDEEVDDGMDELAGWAGTDHEPSIDESVTDDHVFPADEEVDDVDDVDDVEEGEEVDEEAD